MAAKDPKVIDGKAIAAKVTEEVKAKVQELVAKGFVQFDNWPSALA